MASDRRRGFETWARTSGDPAIRSHDRRTIAEDLFELAGDGEVGPQHVEELARRYRERFAGAQKILLVQQVGDEIASFQAEPAPPAPRAHDARREDDEVIGIALDPIQLMGREAVPAGLAHPSLDLPPEPVSLSPAAPFAHSLPEPPAPAGPALAVPPPAVPPPSPSSPERPRSGAAVGWAAPPRTGTAGRSVAEPPPRADPGSDVDGAEPAAGGLWAPLRDEPARDEPGGIEPGRDEPGGIELGGPEAPAPPRAASSRPPPQVAALGRLDVAGLSSRPPPRPPPGGAPVPTGLGAPPVPVFAAPTPAASTADEARRFAPWIGGAAAALLLLGLVVARPSCIFAPPTEEVQGRFASPHLGVAITFPEPWLHEARRDDDESRGDWERSSSVFFQGVDVDEFAIQLTLVTLTHGGRPASEDDLRSIGAAELAGSAQSRKCAPYDRYGAKAVRCTGLEMRSDRRFAMLEEYFVAGPRVVYARGLVETVVGAETLSAPAASAGPAPSVSAAGPGRSPADAMGSPLSDLDARRLEAVLDSIQPLD